MRVRTSILILTAILTALFCRQPHPLAAQTYDSLYEEGKYAEALDMVKQDINAYYADRLEDKNIPTDIISMMPEKDEPNLKQMFRSRKAKGFFIEDNPKLSALHVRAGDCYKEMNMFREAISSYTQALRLKTPEAGDHTIYYAMSLVYGKADEFEGRIKSLEAAFTFAPENYAYSLEIGRALAPTQRKKKALYHLVRYLENVAAEEIDPKLYLTAAGLNEDLGYFLETVRWYQTYLQAKPDDAAIRYALGYVAYTHTGNHKLAVASFARALELLPEDDIYRRSKAYEYTGDIALSDVRYASAIAAYGKTFDYQRQVKAKIDETKATLDETAVRINELKIGILKTQDYKTFEEYEALEEKRGKLAVELSRMNRQYESLNCGVVRWNAAYCHEQLEEYPKAIELYREAIGFDYKTNDCREKIIKLQLKIKRGF